MDNHEPGVWLNIAHLAELHRQADQPRQASRIPGRTGGPDDQRPRRQPC
jgi:hypothetical protein